MTAARLHDMPIDQRRGLSRTEAATYCGVSVDLFSRECPIQPIRLGGRVLFLRDRLDAWLSSLQVDARPVSRRQWTPSEKAEAIHAAFAPQHRNPKARQR